MGTTQPLDEHGPRVLEIAARLDRRYGPRRWRSHGSPLDELIATVLSQHTSDFNTARAFRSLRERFPTWDLVRAAPTGDVADAVRGGGLANLKAPRIQRILGALAAAGDPSLASLATMPTDAARRWLCVLPGVGPKTAACVLLFALGKPALPVDTHVHRVARRLGLIAAGVPPERAHAPLEAALGEDRDRVYAFHLNLIAHGREVCVARRPRCERCVLTDRCDFFAASSAADA
jgi:endonuclease-3